MAMFRMVKATFSNGILLTSVNCVFLVTSRLTLSVIYRSVSFVLMNEFNIILKLIIFLSYDRVNLSDWATWCSLNYDFSTSYQLKQKCVFIYVYICMCVRVRVCVWVLPRVVFKRLRGTRNHNLWGIKLLNQTDWTYRTIKLQLLWEW
jgi:hypothetical protein